MKSQLHPAVVIGVIAAALVIVVIIAVKIAAPSHPQATVTPRPGEPLSHGSLTVSDAQRYQERMQQMAQQRAAEQHPQGR